MWNFRLKSWNWSVGGCVWQVQNVGNNWSEECLFARTGSDHLRGSRQRFGVGWWNLKGNCGWAEDVMDVCWNWKETERDGKNGRQFCGVCISVCWWMFVWHGWVQVARLMTVTADHMTKASQGTKYYLVPWLSITYIKTRRQFTASHYIYNRHIRHLPWPANPSYPQN